jgi:hypothetical protein
VYGFQRPTAPLRERRELNLQPMGIDSASDRFGNYSVPIQEARIHVQGLWGRSFEHETDHGEPREGGDNSRVALEIAREASIAVDPGECPLGDSLARLERAPTQMRKGRRTVPAALASKAHASCRVTTRRAWIG